MGGVGGVFISDFPIIHVARNMCNLGLKGLLHILIGPIIKMFYYFRCTYHLLIISLAFNPCNKYLELNEYITCL